MFDFPASPTTGQTFTPPGGPSYIWNGYGWAFQGSTGAVAPKVQRFTASGTYTPSPNLVGAIVECIAGGGGAGATAGATGVNSWGASGGSGGYSRAALTPTQIGSSQPITIGPGGAGGISPSPSTGGNGGDTSFGSLVVAKGGFGAGPVDNAHTLVVGGAGGPVTGAVGDVTSAGAPGEDGAYVSGALIMSGGGGSSALGGGGAPVGLVANTANPGNNASNYGSGGSGGFVNNAAAAAIGGNGSPGVCLVTEFIGQIAAVPAVPTTGTAALGGLLSYVSATSLKFVPYLGNYVRLNGALRAIPASGLVGLNNTSVFVNGVAAQNLVANTTYLVFLFDNAGTLTADFRTGATHATSTTIGNEGVEILTGDDTRSLIGQCRTNASSQFFLDGQNIAVLSWFNRRPRSGQGVFTASRTTTTTTYVELHSEIRVNFLCWSDPVQIGLGGSMNNSVAGGAVSALANIDGTINLDGGSTSVSAGAGGWVPTPGNSIWTPTSEGWHYATYFGCPNTGTATFAGGGTVAVPARCSVTVNVQG